MKINIPTFLTLTLILSFSSCKPVEYFQVYKVSPQKAQTNESSIDFVNDDCVVSYNLLANGGNAGFSLYNKTNDFIIIKLDKTFFIRNNHWVKS